MLETAVEVLGNYDLIIYPTETVYGLGSDALTPEAVEKVFTAKQRSRSEPISIAFPSVNAALEYTKPDSKAKEFMHRFLPGPITPIVNKTEEAPDIVTADRDNVGVRVPDNELALELLENYSPITATSANISGNPPARSVNELDDITQEVEVVLDGGTCRYGEGSTVVDTTSWNIIREGVNAGNVKKWLKDQHLFD